MREMVTDATTKAVEMCMLKIEGADEIRSKYVEIGLGAEITSEQILRDIEPVSICLSRGRFAF